MAEEFSDVAGGAGTGSGSGAPEWRPCPDMHRHNYGRRSLRKPWVMDQFCRWCDFPNPNHPKNR